MAAEALVIARPLAMTDRVPAVRPDVQRSVLEMWQVSLEKRIQFAWQEHSSPERQRLPLARRFVQAQASSAR
jgi:hypothetical protein